MLSLLMIPLPPFVLLIVLLMHTYINVDLKCVMIPDSKISLILIPRMALLNLMKKNKTKSRGSIIVNRLDSSILIRFEINHLKSYIQLSSHAYSQVKCVNLHTLVFPIPLYIADRTSLFYLTCPFFC